MPALFGYDEAVLARYPTIRAGVVHAIDLANGPSPPDLVDELRREQAAILGRLADTPLSEVPSIAAWRRVFTAFGVKPTQYRSAVEALLRRLTKQGDIPSINLLVDIGNLVSIRYALPVAVFDQTSVVGGTTVRFADGDEEFTDLGASEPTHPTPGEVIFADAARVVSARRWCWRQSDQSATREGTTEVLITVEGHHEAADADVPSALGDLLDLLADYQPDGRWESALLSPDAPVFGEG